MRRLGQPRIYRTARLRLDRCDTLSVSTGNRFAATLEVLSLDVRPGDTLLYRINNTGFIELICGVGYRLERKTADGWILMNPGMAFQAIGLSVLPDENRELRAMIPADAPPGLYRISTSVNSDHAARTLGLSAGFGVQRN